MLQSTTKPFRNVERMYHESLHFQAIRGAYISSTNEQKQTRDLNPNWVQFCQLRGGIIISPLCFEGIFRIQKNLGVNSSGGGK